MIPDRLLEPPTRTLRGHGRPLDLLNTIPILFILSLAKAHLGMGMIRRADVLLFRAEPNTNGGYTREWLVGANQPEVGRRGSKVGVY